MTRYISITNCEFFKNNKFFQKFKTNEKIEE